jgi:hypothetical protein
VSGLKAVIRQFADLAGWGATPEGNTNIVYAAKAVLASKASAGAMK